ncbi:MAG: Ca2+:H+ antiporter [Miltoncostaeaceae bacterium]|jgi:Ca2+:H+ antiporter|nr:Ca2+:H+ antiporter [Miltoncostaeaceae bacterium]
MSVSPPSTDPADATAPGEPPRWRGLTRAQRLGLVATFVAAGAAGALHYGGAAGIAAFTAATLALGGLAWLVSFATEALGERTGPAVTGVLQSTLGNLPELFVVIFALRAGEVVVAQASIVGSLLANALLVLGFTLIAGARAAPDGVMRFHRRLPNDTATLLMLAVFIIVLLGISGAANDRASRHQTEISAIGAVALLSVYVFWLLGYLRPRTGGVEPALATHRQAPHLSLAVTIALLAAGGAGAALVSEWFIAELEPAIETLGVSRAFAGLVIVAIAGNAAEHVAGIFLAAKGKSDLAVSVVKNSVSQIAVFLFPVLILISLAFESRLTFVIPPVQIGALFLMAIAVWQVTGDGEAEAFEGWALVALYVLTAVVTFYE